MKGAVAAVLLVAAMSPRARADAPVARDVVNVAVKPRVSDVSACYQKAALRRPWLAGWVVLNFTIEESGDVGAVQIERTEIDDVAFLACAQDALRSLKIARAPGGGPVAFSYPFVFAGGGGGDPSALVDGQAMPTTLPARCTLPAQCRQLGVGLTRGDDASRARAFAFFEAGCKLNDGASCAGAAAALDFGRGVAKDKRRALASYVRACALHARRACTAVAMTHALGGVEGVAKDERLGQTLLERACAAGEGAACLDVAERLRFGVGVVRNEARAVELRRATLDERQRP